MKTIAPAALQAMADGTAIVTGAIEIAAVPPIRVAADIRVLPDAVALRKPDS